MQEKLPPTDSRLRPDQRYLENGEYEMANSEKLRLEQCQRQVSFMFLFCFIVNSMCPWCKLARDEIEFPGTIDL